MEEKLPSISPHSAKRTLYSHGLTQLIEFAEWMYLDHNSEGAVQADSNAATIDPAQRKLELSTCR